MRSMSDTIARLAKLRQRPGFSASGAAGGRLADLQGFGSNPGALTAKVHVPRDPPQGAPLVVVLHGCTQTADAYDHGAAWSDLADQAGFAVLYPQQARANNPNLCFNWFVPADTSRDIGEAGSIRQMIEAVVLAHGIDRRRIYVTGLSAGGAMAASMLAAYPDIFAGGAIIAGLPHGCAATVPEAFDRMRGHGIPSAAQLQARLAAASRHAGPWPTLSIWQGSADSTVAPSNAEAILAQWRKVHALSREPERTETVDGQRRRVWVDADGRPLVESFTIAGMGHGTPLDPTRGGGRSGPFMLDAGISSTHHIARFWGVLGEVRRTAEARPDRTPALDGEILPPGTDRPAAPASAGSGVGAVIEDALRAAGLMK